MTDTRQPTKTEVRRLIAILLTKERLDEEDLQGMSQMRKRTVLDSLRRTLRAMGMDLWTHGYRGRWCRFLTHLPTQQGADERM